MEILAAVFIDTIDVRPVPGPSTRIDLGGIKFSEPAPGPFPVTVEPHLVVLVRNPADAKPDAVLETTYHRDGEEIARNIQVARVEPGKFGYQLVRAELTFEEPGSVEAHVRLDQDPHLTVPYTLLPPVE